MMRRGIAARYAAANDSTDDESDETGGYVVHLPVRTRNLTVAMRLARALARSLGFLPEFEPGGTTVSREDEQGVRHRVFCDRRLAGGVRCLLRPDHRGPCLLTADSPTCPESTQPLDGQ